MENLKPCPFCGSEMESFAGMLPGSFAKSGILFAVECDCGAMGPFESSMEKAIAAWNTRTDISNALIAAAYEAAGNKANELKSLPEDDSHWSDQYIRGHAAAGIGIAYCIRALTPDDARAAYDAAIRAAKIEGMREAANRANGCDRVSEVAPAITALIKETEKGGE